MAFVGTTTPLGSNATYTSVGREALDFDSIVGTVYADQAGTIYIEQSPDGTNWDVSTSYNISASNGNGFTESIVAPYWRVKYTNGAAAQGTFRLSARTAGAGSYS